MRSSPLSLGFAASWLVILLAAAPAHAQATRTFISGVGNDADPCSRTAPCRTFAGAIVKTFINGEINCLDPGGYGTVNITKSITIDCHEAYGSDLASGTTGIIINIPAGNVNDPLRTVRLRNLNITGTGASGAVGTRTGINGIRIDSAVMVLLEDMHISNFSQNGVLVNNSSSNVNVVIERSTIANNGGNPAHAGILIKPLSGGTSNVTVSRTSLKGNFNGIFLDGGGAGPVNLNVHDTVVTNSANVGIVASSNGAALTALIDRTIVTSSVNAGVAVSGAAATMRIGNSTVSGNVTGVLAVNGGNLRSYKNNQINGNGTDGTPIAAADVLN